MAFIFDFSPSRYLRWDVKPFLATLNGVQTVTGESRDFMIFSEVTLWSHVGEHLTYALALWFCIRMEFLNQKLFVLIVIFLRWKSTKGPTDQFVKYEPPITLNPWKQRVKWRCLEARNCTFPQKFQQRISRKGLQFFDLMRERRRRNLVKTGIRQTSQFALKSASQRL